MGRMPSPSAPQEEKPAQEHFVSSPSLPVSSSEKVIGKDRSHKTSNHQLEKVQINANMVSFLTSVLVRGFSPQADGMGYKYIFS